MSRPRMVPVPPPSPWHTLATGKRYNNYTSRLHPASLTLMFRLASPRSSSEPQRASPASSSQPLFTCQVSRVAMPLPRRLVANSSPSLSSSAYVIPLVRCHVHQHTNPTLSSPTVPRRPTTLLAAPTTTRRSSWSSATRALAATSARASNSSRALLQSKTKCQPSSYESTRTRRFAKLGGADRL